MNVPEDVRNAICKASRLTGVAEDLLTAFAFVESGFRRDVIEGGATSKTKVKGLFQITEDTWHRYRKSVGYSLDINEQAYTAALIIRDLHDKYNGNKDLMCIGYNGGEGVSDSLLRLGGINEANIKIAVSRDKGKKGFGPEKVKEILNYPKRLSEALGEHVFPVSATKEASVIKVTTSDKAEEVIKCDPNKTLFENLFTLSNDHIRNVSLDSNYAKSKLVSLILNGLSHLSTHSRVKS